MPDTFDTAVALLNSADEEKRLEGIRLLGTIEEARAATELIRFVRWECKKARYMWLAMVRQFRLTGYPPIVEDLRQRNWRLETEAAKALVSIGYNAVAPLSNAIATLSPLLGNTAAEELFIWALGEIGDLSALSVLYPLVRFRYEGAVRIAAQEAIKKIESGNADILDKPIPAAEPQPSVERLPIPAKEPEFPTENLPRPAEERDD
jgi:HEAT repeat protein